MKTPNQGFRFWRGFAAGALAMYIFDPTADRRLRSEVNRRALHAGRRGARHLARLIRFGWSQAQGTEQRFVHRHPGPPADDIALLDRIDSEIYRVPGLPKGSFNVDVVRGVTVLRGQLRDQASIDLVLTAVRGVEGVGELRSFLHLPGTPAPNKEAALAAGGRG